MTYAHTFFLNDETFEVVFEGFPQWENNGIGSYEFWGTEGFDEGDDYLSFESNGSPTWDKSLYSAEQNAFIESKMDEVEKGFLKEYKNLNQ